MSMPLKAIVALDARVDRQVVETLLTSSPRVSVVDYTDLQADGKSPDGGDVLVVACTAFSEHVAQYSARASHDRPQRPVILLAGRSENGYVADAFEHGVDDIMTLPDGADIGAAAALAPGFVFALEKAIARKRGGQIALDRGLGEMICVLGLKGGSGKTLTTANLAVALADAGKRVSVVDLDLQFGDVGLALGLAPERTLYDLVRAGGSLDVEKLGDFMSVHQSGVRALLAPTRPDQAGLVTSDFLRDVFRTLREMSDFVVVDTPPGFTPEVIGAVDSSTCACMVAMLDSLSLKNTKLGFETLERMDYPHEIRFVLNRADSKVGISAEDVLAIMGRQPSVLVPSDRNVTRSINEGTPIVIANRRSEAARAFHGLAALYLGDATLKPPLTSAARPATTKRRHLFGRR
jgi:pilus assembly protein CpaE